MRLRMTASLLTLLCSWVLWEKWIDYNVSGSGRVIQAVFEAKSLVECRTAMPDFIKQREIGFKNAYKPPEYSILSDGNSTILTRKAEGANQQYVYYCLPSTVDPYHDPR